MKSSNNALLTVITSCFSLLSSSTGFSPTNPIGLRSPSFVPVSLLSSLSSSSSSSEEFDMQELKQRINQEYYGSHIPIKGKGEEQQNAVDDFSPQFSSDAEYDEILAPSKIRNDGDTIERPEQVYVVVIQPETINQGAHTIEYPKGSGKNIVLAFESFEACEKFANSLEIEQQFLDATPLPYQFDQLENFFGGIGVSVQLIPEGVELKPPSANVKKFGHNPTLCDTRKHLEYLFEMNEEELEEIGLVLEDEEEDSAFYAPTSSWE